MAASKVALVTASSAGLGAAIAKALGKEMRVVINYNSSREKADAVLSELSKNSGLSNEKATPLYHAIQADVSKKSEIERLVKETVSTMGRLDVVVSNAGWTRMSNFNDLDDNVVEEDWDRCFNVNVKSHLFLLHAARKHLDETEGAFVSVASVAGVKPSGSSLAYAVTKAAHIYMSRCLSTIVSPKVRVNCVSPGILMTDWGRTFSEEKLNAAREKCQLGRFATVEDVAQHVKCLALNSSTTGTNIVIDSGFSI